MGKLAPVSCFARLRNTLCGLAAISLFVVGVGWTPPVSAQTSSTPVALPTARWIPRAFASTAADVAARAVDGSVATRWSSGKAQAIGQTFDIDMGTPQMFSRVSMDAGSSTGDYPRGFEVRSSTDGTTWSGPLGSVTGTSQIVSASFPLTTARFVRIALTKAGTNWWSIHELSVLGLPNDATPVALKRTGWVATASVTCPGDVPSNALDGNVTTRWSTGVPQAKSQYFQVDMKTAQVFNRLALDSGASAGDYPRGFDIVVSNDGTHFGAPVASGTGTSQATTLSFPYQTARYVRVVISKSASNWFSIHEINVFGLATPLAAAAVPAANVEPVPGYDPGSYGCAPGLALGASAVDAQGQTYYQSVAYAAGNGGPAPGPSCAGGVQFCDNTETPIPSPSAAALNAAAPSTGQCGAIGSGDKAACGVDPATLKGNCTTAANCAADEICALACDTPGCAQPTKRCGKLYQSCGGIPAETSFCDPVTYRICADPQAKGQVTLADLDQQMPTRSALSATIQVGPNEKATVPPYAPLPAGYCTFQDVPISTSKTEVSSPETNLGNKQWGVFLEPFAEQRLGLNKAEHWYEDSFEIGGSAGVRAGAYVFGAKLTALSGQIDVALSDCHQEIGATVKLFGDAVATLDTLDGFSTSFGHLVREEDDMKTPAAYKDDCTKKFDTRNQKSGDFRTAMFSARNVKKFYLDKGVSKDLCKRTNAALSKNFDCNDANLGNNIAVPNAWIDEYSKAAEAFKSAQTDFRVSRDGLSFSLQKGFVSLGGKPYRLTAAEQFVPIGPVTLTLAIEVFGNIFLNGGIQVGAAYNGSLLQGLQDLTPYGGLLGTPADISVATGPFFTPGASLQVAAFAGAGIPGVSIGIEGTVNLLSISLPMDARISATRTDSPDSRDVQASPYAGPAIPGVANTVKKWQFGGAFGIRAKLSALDGEMDGAIRIRILFAHKTFKKRFFKWKGLLDVDKVIVGGQAGAPLKHRDDLGINASRIAFTGVEPVSATDVPANPSPNAFLIGNLTGESCVPIIP
jgi:F5/8 type C domain